MEQELLLKRHEELCNAIRLMRIDLATKQDCIDSAHGIVGIVLGGDYDDFEDVGNLLYRRSARGCGEITLDEAVTILNNLPIGLEITMLQRNEAIRGTELEGDCIQLGEDNESSLDNLECEYELTNAKGIVHKSAQEYVYALENLVSQMQAKSFTDSSKLTALEYDIDELKNLIPELLEASGE